METEEERRARLENDAATERLRLVVEMDEERKARLAFLSSSIYTISNLLVGG